jgi:hypothetical protein
MKQIVAPSVYDNGGLWVKAASQRVKETKEMNNLFVAYDLISPGQNYEAIRNEIKKLGNWYQFQYSLYYVNTALSAQAAHDQVRRAMDANDKLVVVDASGGFASNYPINDINAVNRVWLAA